MRLLTKDNLCLAEDGIWWIKSARQKTKIEFEIPLLDLPLQILKKYSGTAPGDKLLPMYCNSTLNLYLKEIARICHIDRPLVFHAGRHTYATEITLSHGVPLETVSRMLGHSQIETTQIYAKVTDEKIDADTKALNRKSRSVFLSSFNNLLNGKNMEKNTENRMSNDAALLPCCFILTARKCERTECASYCAR